MRKITLFLSLLLLLCAVVPVAAMADNPYYEFVILEDGTAELTRITPEAPGIPHQIEGHPLTSIADGALAEVSFQNVVIPESVTHLGSGILGVANVDSVTFPNTITQMDGPLFTWKPESRKIGIFPAREAYDNEATDKLPNLILDPNHPYLAIINGVLFSKPDKRLIGHPQNRNLYSEIKRYDIPNGIEIIETYSFSRTQIQNLTIPATVTTIKESAFAYSGTSFLINNANITEISDYCFAGSKRLQITTIPGTVTSIGTGAFQNCEKLQALECPSGVVSIGDYAFQNCSLLAEFVIPEGATIGVGVFDGCTNLRKVTIPNSVQNLTGNPFADCEELSIILPEDHPTYATISGVLFSKADKKLISFPSMAAKEYEVPNGIVEIGTEAFAGRSNLQTVKIPASVTKIADDAFSGCGNLLLIVEVGSYAETYATRQGFQYNYSNSASNSDWLNG